MKLAACPWCEGKGTIIKPDTKAPLTNDLGSMLMVVSEDCKRCLGCGVIRYEPAEESKDQND